MPAIPVVPDAYRVRLQWHTAAHNFTGSIVLHFRSLAGWRSPADLLARLNARYTANMIRGMVVTAVPAGARIFDMGQPNATVTLAHTWQPTVVVGGLFNPAISPAIIARPDGVRAGPTMLRIPIMRGNIGLNGKIDPAIRPSISAAWQTFRAGMLTDGWQWGRPAGPEGGWLPFATVYCRPEVATMRRRMAEVWRGPRSF